MYQYPHAAHERVLRVFEKQPLDGFYSLWSSQAAFAGSCGRPCVFARSGIERTYSADNFPPRRVGTFALVKWKAMLASFVPLARIAKIS